MGRKSKSKKVKDRQNQLLTLHVLPKIVPLTFGVPVAVDAVVRGSPTWLIAGVAISIVAEFAQAVLLTLAQAFGRVVDALTEVEIAKHGTASKFEEPRKACLGPMRGLINSDRESVWEQDDPLPGMGGVTPERPVQQTAVS